MNSSPTVPEGQRPLSGKTERSLSAKLAMYLLYTEAGVIFFLTMVVYGLKVLPAAWAFVSGAVVFILFLIVGRMTHTKVGMWAGWVLQLGLILLGFLVSEMFIIGIIFALMWIYTLVKARQIEKQ